MSKYMVTWTIELDTVNSPLEAAKEALEIQRDKDSHALRFGVTDLKTGEKTYIDLRRTIMSKKIDYVCNGCGSTNVNADANVSWNKETQEFNIEHVWEEDWYCVDCETFSKRIKQIEL